MSESSAESAPRGSVREGVCLGLLLHIGIQAFYTYAFVRGMGLDIESAVRLVLTIGGVTQLPYMVPAMVDAQLMRRRALTTRGLGVVAMGVMCVSLWFALL